MKLWLVTLTRETTVAVYAPTREDAASAAYDASNRGDVEWEACEEEADAVLVPDDAHGWDDETPYGLDEDDDRTVAEIRSGVPDPETERAEWLARRPAEATPATLVAWLGGAPPLRSGRRPWCGAVEGGAAACDGYAVAWAEDAIGRGDTTVSNGKPWSVAYGEMIGRLTEPARTGRVTLESLREWLAALCPHTDSTRYGSILGVTVQRTLVERWALPFLELSGSCEVIARDGEAQPIELRGPGWRVHVMPARADGDGALAVEAP